MDIVICGSMTFAQDMKLAQEQLSAMGHQAHLPPNVDKYLSGNDVEKSSEKISLDVYRYYHELIKESDAVLVLNHQKKGVAGYVGANALIEMVFGHVHGKKVFLLHDVPRMDHTEEILAIKPIVLHGDLKNLR